MRSFLLSARLIDQDFLQELEGSSEDLRSTGMVTILQKNVLLELELVLAKLRWANEQAGDLVVDVVKEK